MFSQSITTHFVGTACGCLVLVTTATTKAVTSRETITVETKTAEVNRVVLVQKTTTVEFPDGLVRMAIEREAYTWTTPRPIPTNNFVAREEQVALPAFSMN